MKTRELPPLILYPFSQGEDPLKLTAASRAALMLAGALPDEGMQPEDLIGILLQGRFLELRMLYFVGKDVFRWMEQCVDTVAREAVAQEAVAREAEASPPWRPQSFAAVLFEDCPEAARNKLESWGVLDPVTLFARGIALYTLFRSPPEQEWLQPDFIRDYHKVCDAIYREWLAREAWRRARAGEFTFDLYASGEYTRLLESQWKP